MAQGHRGEGGIAASGHTPERRSSSALSLAAHRARLVPPAPRTGFAWRAAAYAEFVSAPLPVIGHCPTSGGGRALRRRCPTPARKVVSLAKRHALEKPLGVKFKDPALLDQALVHSSYVNENPNAAPGSNERLEFLGDAVLGLVVADELFTAYPDQDEGQLTELRTLLVRRDTLAKAARRLKLGDDLYLGKGEEAGGGRSRPTNLAHAYEALVGAVFLDRGLTTARKFVRSSLKQEFDSLPVRPFPLDPKSRLQEVSQSR